MMSDSQTGGARRDSTAVDSPRQLNTQLEKLEVKVEVKPEPREKRSATKAAAAAAAAAAGKCMLWNHPANPTPTAPEPVRVPPQHPVLNHA